jgi:hypothetical protein
VAALNEPSSFFSAFRTKKGPEIEVQPVAMGMSRSGELLLSNAIERA